VSSIFRPDQIFFRWYGRQYANVLRCFSRFYVQNDISKQLLGKLGITDVVITGDTRFDRVLQIKEKSKQLPIVEAFKQGRKVFVAGSSWAPDEDIFIPYFNEHKDWKLIVAPHVIGEDHLKQILQKFEGKAMRYTQATAEEAAQADCLIIDCFGLLSSVYHYGEVAYVGGGFGVGIHNVLEAAVWDMPVVFGPNNKNFHEAQGIMEQKGGFEITDAAGFKALMERFANEPGYLEQAGEKAGAFVKSRAGATDRILSDVNL
jgi:3-deoxy-D-manno-octulosonic-acid transferase